MDVIQYFNQNISLSEEVNDKLYSLFKDKEYKKGHILFAPESRPDKLIFVEKGLIRLYYLKEEKDITFLFFGENSFTMPIESVIYNKPCLYGCQLLEDSIIWSISYKDFEKQFEKMPFLEGILRNLLFEVLEKTTDKLYALQFQTAEQRYQYMLESYPNILLRAPLGHIASYLGITQQTLSVIRAKL